MKTKRKQSSVDVSLKSAIFWVQRIEKRKEKMFYPLVSVIIPVYQAEKFLTECVESVRKQDYSELEIVLVNDGSTDRSNQMCEELAAADPRIRVIHQNNKGSGAARNAGIKEATGKYLLFLDADDKLDDSSAIRSLAARAEREQADIVIGTYRRWRANGEKSEMLQ